MIGTLRERPLHASLKAWYAQPGDRTEVPMDGYVIDLVRGELLIEVQTRGLSSARHKLRALLGRGRQMRVVLPVAYDTWIVRSEDDGTVLSRRRSPRHGSQIDAFGELVSIAGLLAEPRLEIDIVTVEIEERRQERPDGPWRRRGWAVEERRLVAVLDTYPIRGKADLGAFLPPGLPDPFTTIDLQLGPGCSRRLAQQMAYCLRAAGVIEAVGARGRAVAYRSRLAS